MERNSIATNDLPGLIASVHRAIATVGQDAAPAADELRKTTTAQVRKSITPEALISFEDGKPYRLLKRHLGTRGLTPAEDREKWELPADYPMVAPAYAEKRSEFAKAAGLGRKTGAGAKGGRKRAG